MKRLFKILLVIICVLLLTGCSSDSSDEDREDMFWQLEKDKIISSKVELIDIVVNSYWTSEHCESTTYYIYRDENDNLFALRYIDNGSDTHSIYYYSIIDKYEVVYDDDLKCTDTIYQYSDEKKSMTNKYGLSTPTIYNAKKNDFFLFNKYKIEKA